MGDSLRHQCRRGKAQEPSIPGRDTPDRAIRLGLATRGRDTPDRDIRLGLATQGRDTPDRDIRLDLATQGRDMARRRASRP